MNPFAIENQNLEIERISDQIIEIENQLQVMKQLETKQKELKENLKEAMKNHNIKKWETPNGIKFALIDDVPDEVVTTSEVNEKRFEEENKELCDKYHETRKQYLEDVTKLVKGKKGYVRITLPKEDK